MMWSPQQDAALVAVDRWFQYSDEPVFRLFGYAGTGKTTLAKQIAEDLGGDVLFGAYTGKASSVLKRKGCDGAQTVHRMIYKPLGRFTSRRVLSELIQELKANGKTLKQIDTMPEIIALKAQIKLEDKEGNLCFELNEDSIVQHADLVILDECSMINEQMATDLLSFGTRVLVLGDPAQLPPVRGSGYFTDCRPDFMLDEVHRQAKGNPIIDLATMARNHQRIPGGVYGTSRVIDGSIHIDEAIASDQILTYTNARRHKLNAAVRNKLFGHGVTDDPVEDDKLVRLSNDYDLGMMNGTLWRVLDINSRHHTMTVYPDDAEDDDGHNAVVSSNFNGRFDYGYALTVHKAQGSQWSNIVVRQEPSFLGQNFWEWLYTAITRAADRVTLVRGY